MRQRTETEGSEDDSSTSMRTASEVNEAVQEARERLPSDTWSPEAQRTTREGIVQFGPMQAPPQPKNIGKSAQLCLKLLCEVHSDHGHGNADNAIGRIRLDTVDATPRILLPNDGGAEFLPRVDDDNVSIDMSSSDEDDMDEIQLRFVDSVCLPAAFPLKCRVPGALLASFVLDPRRGRPTPRNEPPATTEIYCGLGRLWWGAGAAAEGRRWSQRRWQARQRRWQRWQPAAGA
jgi:hypothetical protein